MVKFGKNRVDDLTKEHSYLFRDLEVLVNAFRSGNRHYKYSGLMKLLEENFVSYVGTSNIPDIDSRPYHSLEQLGEFLYKVEFISAKLQSSDQPNESFRYQDDPSLFKTIENRRDEVNWLVHPSYRFFLRIR